MRSLAPTTLLMTCWTLTLGVAIWTIANPNHFDLVSVFMAREELSLSVFGLIGAMWIGLAFLVYCIGDLAAQVATRQSTHQMRRSNQENLNLARAARLTFWVNALLLGVTVLWVASSAAKAGGIIQLAAMAYLDSLGARDLMLENKLFTGMRLFYAALPATGCLAAAILTVGRHSLHRRAKQLCWAVLCLNTVALFILPLVMSQRLLLLQFLLSAYLVSCLLRRRIFGVPWLLCGAALFFATWVLREAVTNPLIQRSALDIGTQKLAFYFVNDLWNAFAPLQAEIGHTMGAVSLRGLMFLTFTDGMFARILMPRMEALDAVLGGGDFPFFTAAFVDFGALAGAAFIALCAFAFRLLFVKAQTSLGWAALYAQLGAALLFSSHGIYFTHQNFLFSLLVICLIYRLSHTHTAAAKHVPVAAETNPPEMPNVITSQVRLLEASILTVPPMNPPTKTPPATHKEPPRMPAFQSRRKKVFEDA